MGRFKWYLKKIKNKKYKTKFFLKTGFDAVIIAYDALLGCNKSWEELCKRAMLHGGDNDTTGCIAGAWYGALYGFEDVPQIHYRSLEKKDQLIEISKKLFILSGISTS